MGNFLLKAIKTFFNNQLGYCWEIENFIFLQSHKDGELISYHNETIRFHTAIFPKGHPSILSEYTVIYLYFASSDQPDDEGQVRMFIDGNSIFDRLIYSKL